MSTDDLTFGQIRVLNFVEDHLAATGRLPSVPVIAEATGLGDGTVRLAVDYLTELGYLHDDREAAA